MLKPVYFVPDPIRGGDDILVMCEVLNADGSVHKSNNRAACVAMSEKFLDEKPWFGIEPVSYTHLTLPTSVTV